MLSNVDSKQVGSAVMSMLHGIQNQSKEIQIASIGLAFRCVLEEFDVSFGDVMTVTANLESKAKAEKIPEILTIRTYIKNELKK